MNWYPLSKAASRRTIANLERMGATFDGRQTKTGHTVLAFHPSKDEAFVEGFGWCKYSHKLSAILIHKGDNDNGWHTF